MNTHILGEIQIDTFLKKRSAGILLNNEFEMQEMFNLKPHEVEMLKKIVIFKVDVMKKKGRVLDI